MVPRRKISLPAESFNRYMAIARALGYVKRGQRWHFLDMMLPYAEMHADLFRRRP
jgi:hypothetical protein